VQVAGRVGEPSITRPRAVLIVLSCFVADQLLKLAVRAWLAPGQSVPLLGDWLRLSHVENRAGVMGIRLLPMWALTLISLPAVALMAWWLWKQLPARSWLARLLPWVLGGAAGNLWDRLGRGRVTDMFDVDIPDIHLGAGRVLGLDFPGFHLERWWVFNLADSFLFVCMIWILLLGLLGRLEEPAAPPRPGEPEASG